MFHYVCNRIDWFLKMKDTSTFNSRCNMVGYSCWSEQLKVSLWRLYMLLLQIVGVWITPFLLPGQDTFLTAMSKYNRRNNLQKSEGKNSTDETSTPLEHPLPNWNLSLVTSTRIFTSLCSTSTKTTLNRSRAWQPLTLSTVTLYTGWIWVSSGKTMFLLDTKIYPDAKHGGASTINKRNQLDTRFAAIYSNWTKDKLRDNN